VGAGLLARDGAVGVSWGLTQHGDEPDADYELRWCGGAACAAELKAQIAVGGFVGIAAGAVEMRRIHRHGEQQRRYRKEGDPLSCARLTERLEHSAHLTTLIADGFDLDGGVFEAKPEGACLFPKCAIQNRIVDFGHSPADVAHQELTAVILFGAITTQECVQGVETMHESGVLEELQGAVNSGRGSLFAIFGQFRQDLIGADGLVLAPDDLENAPSQRGQVDLPRCAHLLGRRDRALNTLRVVMRRSLSINHSRHTALSRAHPGCPRAARCRVSAPAQGYTVTPRWTFATDRDVITLRSLLPSWRRISMNHVPGRSPAAAPLGFPPAGKAQRLNYLPRNREGTPFAAVTTAATSTASVGGSAVVAAHPSVFEHIFAPGVTVCIWNRQPDPILTNYLRESACCGSWERRTRVDVAAPQFEELLTGFKADVGRVRWVTELSALIDLFATLTDSRTVGLRMTATDRATCPRFHSDQVGLRLLCSWLGAGTEWLSEEDVIRPSAERPDQSTRLAVGPVRPGGVVRQMRPFAVGVFKGDLWPKNHGRGAMHRSPQPMGRRVFVSLDEL
jgi:hypothetical protein